MCRLHTVAPGSCQEYGSNTGFQQSMLSGYVDGTEGERKEEENIFQEIYNQQGQHLVLLTTVFLVNFWQSFSFFPLGESNRGCPNIVVNDVDDLIKENFFLKNFKKCTFCCINCNEPYKCKNNYKQTSLFQVKWKEE